MARIPYTCPFCGRDTLVEVEKEHFVRTSSPGVESADGTLGIVALFTVCPNPKCRKTRLIVTVCKVKKEGTAWAPASYLTQWRLLPAGGAKPQPDYIPQPIRDDYTEACVILHGSPKASATLARRALQGMIRHFWGIKKRNLAQAVDALKPKIDPPLWAAVDGVRKVGNIGAHMERDVNLIIDVEPDEAQRLIALLELLFVEWYVARHRREETIEGVTALAEAKDVARKAPTAPTTDGTEPTQDATDKGPGPPGD